MKAYCIRVAGNTISEEGFTSLLQSHRKVGNAFSLEPFEASTPTDLKVHGVEWTYPWEGTRSDKSTGLCLSAYRSRSREVRLACFCSHFRLWKKCEAELEPILIIEDDSVFVRRLHPEASELYRPFGFGAVGINDPRGATRRANIYHGNTQQLSHKLVVDAPWVDVHSVPQGLAGNSAYILYPAMATQLIARVGQYGAWPNDALMCRQIFPGLLGQTTTYYTQVSGRPSTLS